MRNVPALHILQKATFCTEDFGHSYVKCCKKKLTGSEGECQGTEVVG